MNDIAAAVAQWVRPEIRALSAYHVPDPGKCVKLDAMENPYGWPPEMVEAWLALLRDAPMNRYPDPAASALVERLKLAQQLPAGMDLLLGNGSDEIILLLALALAAPGRVVLAPEPTFVMYRMIATFAGMDYVGVPLAGDFSLDLEAMRAAIREHRPALTFLAWPNNPTGNLFDPAQVEAIIEESPGLVVVDEAYHPFAERSFFDRLGRYPNLVVMRTLSKFGLAGLRLGFLVGPKPWLDEINKLRLPYNINVLTQISAEFALRHEQVFAHQAALLRAERGRLGERLAALGFTVYPSAANFILFRTDPPERAEALFATLKREGVLIKLLHRPGSPLAGCLRVTVGRPEENDAFLAALASGG